MNFKFKSKEKINQLPKVPGIYFFRKGKKFLYIGKASNIRERVKSHFQQPGYKDCLFLNKVKKIGYIPTSSEIEALILEANLIKKYQPKYNVIWKDSKNYFFIGIIKEVFPRVFITHQPHREGRSMKYEEMKKKIFKTSGFKLQTSFIGPFVDGKALKQTLKILRKVFPYRTCCVGTVGKTLSNKPCLWYQLSRCLAPCLLKSKITREIPSIKVKMIKKYQSNIKNLIKVLQGKKIQVLKNLKKEMNKASAIEDFEEAAKIRNQIFALEKILTHTKILEPEIEINNWEKIERVFKRIFKIKNKVSRFEAYDVSNIQGQSATGAMVTFINGKPEKNFYRRFKIKISGKPNDVAMLKEILSRRFKHSEWRYPDLILIDGGVGQLNAAILKAKTYKLKAKVIALAKKENKLFIEGQNQPVLLKKFPREIFNLFLQLRDEAHRFAISYHKKLRKKKLFD